MGLVDVVKVNQNPQLPESKQSSAFPVDDGLVFSEQELLRYFDKGAPLERINPSVYANDIAGYWRQHLWGLTVLSLFCLIYLLLKILGA